MDSAGRVRWPTAIADIGTHPVRLTVADEYGETITQSFEVTVVPDDRPPVVDLRLEENPFQLDSHPSEPDDWLTIVVTAVDNVGVETVSVTVDGKVVELDSTGRARVEFDTPGVFQVVATAIDRAANLAEATEELTVIDPYDAEAPTLVLITPAPGDVIGTSVDIVGTVDDQHVDYYTLSYAPIGVGSFTEFSRGTTPVIDGVLGRFDPSGLANDTYVLALYAQDLNGHSSRIKHVIDVAGEVKLGNFTLSFTDLTIPVSGIPIVVTRTYDTLNSTEQGELGYGWTLEVRDTDLRTSVPRTGMEEDLIYNEFYYDARVFVSTPGQQRQGFSFQPQPAPGFKGSLLGLWEPVFQPDPGVTSMLSVEPTYLAVTDDGLFVDWTTHLPYNPSSPLFGGTYTLTTKEGLKYRIDGNTGEANRISDRNGNTLDFAYNGVFSSTGKSVQFERDPQGRIEALIDPAGNRVTYAYSAAGDLTQVTDRESHVTRFVYLDSPGHYLEEVIDPLGRLGVRSEYDVTGRLVRMFDAESKSVELIHDPDNFTETVVDQHGNPTVYEYDTLGNVVTQIDAEGSVTRRTYADPANPMLETSATIVLEDGTELTTQFRYDGRGNLLQETDPLGNDTLFTYDKYGNVVTTTDALGHTTTNNYDQSGNLLSTTDAGRVTTTLSYDSAGNPTQIAVGQNVTWFEYDAAGNVTRQEDAAESIRTFTHDSNGNQLTETVSFVTAKGLTTIVTAHEYDGEGRVVRTTTTQDDVVLSSHQTQYDAVGNRISETDALGRVTRYVYDERGLLIATILPDGTPDDDADNPRTATQYDAAGNVVAEIDQLGRRTEYEYDKLGRRIATIQPDNTPQDSTDNPRTSTEFDAAGNVVAEVDSRGNRTRFEYDAVGNRIATILPDDTPEDDTDNPRVTTVYDAASRQISTTDPLGRKTVFGYNAGGILTHTQFHDGTTTISGFDDQHRLVSRTDQNGNTTRYEYDALGRLTSVVQSVGGHNVRTEYEYDQLGNLVVQRDANGHETQFEYDGLGRRVKTVLPDSTPDDLSDNLFSLASYDLAERVASTADFNGHITAYEYDHLDRVIEKDLPSGADTFFTYTATGQQETIVDARGTTTFEYDTRGQLLGASIPTVLRSSTSTMRPATGSK